MLHAVLAVSHTDVERGQHRRNRRLVARLNAFPERTQPNHTIDCARVDIGDMKFFRSRLGKRAFSRARRPRDAKDIRVARMRVQLLHDFSRILTLILDSRNSLRKRKTVTLQDFISYVLHNLHHLWQYKGLPSMKIHFKEGNPY